MARVGDQLGQYIGPAFESICRETVWWTQEKDIAVLPISFAPSAVGRWWSRQEEIDVVAFGEGQALIGECNWSRRPVGVNILDETKRKARPLIAQQGWDNAQHALFSRSSFTEALQNRAANEGVLLIDLTGLADTEPATSSKLPVENCTAI